MNTSAALLFGIATFLMLRARTVKILESIIVGLFGFTLASSMFGTAISAALHSIFYAHAVKNGVPIAPGTPAAPWTSGP
ncbi:hypothetical protein KGQ19_47040 [Catenulispora sp. NL8]|uniref:Uncharacterized protein n=1 Tax=Catenulispora pinistramenti TaxID=2705254 RepID=A0ABS5L7X8_9ACTN|nr:hypothetical protein [Catenulispora pinistramenti]MBS2554436.1 hypothetical protein [Catenulispora pinistramenti]